MNFFEQLFLPLKLLPPYIQTILWLVGMGIIVGWIYWGVKMTAKLPLKKLVRQIRNELSLSSDDLVQIAGKKEVSQLNVVFKQLLRIMVYQQQKIEGLTEQVQKNTHIENKAISVQSANRLLERSLQDLSILYYSLNTFSGQLEESELLHTINRILPDLLDIQHFSLLLFDAHEKTLRVGAVQGGNESLSVGKEFPIFPGAIADALTYQKTIYLTDVQKSAQSTPYGHLMNCQGSFISVPILIRDQVYGVLNLANRKAEAFQTNDLQLFESLASQIAMAYDRTKLYMQTKELSVTDELTGLYNRRHFQDMLQMEWKRGQRFKRSLALLMIDVDYFKSFNDDFGHLQGDRALKIIAEQIVSHVREVDTVARFGGEEFVVLLPDTGLKEAQFVAEKLRSQIETTRIPYVSGDHSRSTALTISIGVASCPEVATSEENLIGRADAALYEAKSHGRNCVVVAKPQIENQQVGEVVRLPIKK